MAASDSEKLASYRKVAQLHTAIKGKFGIEYIKNILQKEGSINYKLTCIETDSDKQFLAADDYMSLQVFELILNYDADFTAKDNEGHTIVHKIIRKWNKQAKSLFLEFLEEFVDAVLSAHVKFENKTNPRCKRNFSHFHAACMRNHTEAVKFFLKNAVDANEAVDVDSSIYAGFTPLHFAVEFSYLETVEILLNHKADMHLRNNAGLSPLDVSLKRVINGKGWEPIGEDQNILEILAKHFIQENTNKTTHTNSFGFSNLHLACVLNDTSLVERILSDRSLDVNQPIKLDSPVYPGYTPLHFAAIFSVDAVKLLLGSGANFEAKDSNDTTPFDLCLQTHKFEDVYNIISSYAKWKDIILSDNQTKLVDLVAAMSKKDEFNKYLANFESITDLIIPTNSALWPGYTILHVAVVLSEIFMEVVDHIPDCIAWTSDTKKVEECLARGVDITKTDVNNQTALHLAFYLQKYRTVELLFRHHEPLENPSDHNGLSHFHMACIAENESAVEKFLSKGVVDINATVASKIKWKALIRSYMADHSIYFFPTPISTALHMNVICPNVKITKMLLDNGADVYAKDSHGFTPIHRLFANCLMGIDQQIAELLLDIDGLRDSVTEGGLTHLHVACMFDKPNAVEKLLNSGADINAVVTYQSVDEYLDSEEYYQDHYVGPSKDLLPYLSRCSGFTPLHFAIKHRNFDAQKLLVERGADISAGSSLTIVPVTKIFGDEHEFDKIVLRILSKDIAFKNQLTCQLGLTILHIACYANKLELVKDLLLQGEDVNSRVDKNSPIWAGDTPLHVAVRNIPRFEDNEDLFGIIILLLQNGADVTLANEDGHSPLHLLSRLYKKPLAKYNLACLLLEALKDFDIDKAHSQKMSLFHLACLMKNVSVVKAFLKNGINVNKSVDLFADRYAGCSPMHLALIDRSDGNISHLTIVNLLLKYGADVCMKDVCDNTTLHSAAGLVTDRYGLFDILIRAGVDVNAVNVRCESALELLIKLGNATWLEVECLLKHGCHVNSINAITEEGWFGKILYRKNNDEWRALEDDFIRNLIDSEYVKAVDKKNRSILHNFVSVRKVNILDYVELISQLVKRGCDINHQDTKGRTPLHLATWFRNDLGVLALLKNGADINVTDKQGKTAFTYSFEKPHDPPNTFDDDRDSNSVPNIFAIHTSKIERCGLYICEVNRQLKIEALETLDSIEETMNRFDENLEKSKEIRMGSTDLTLHEFGSKIDAEMNYPSMPLSKRLEIDQFFENIHQHNLHELDYILKIKHTKAVERLGFINLAIEAFITLIKNQLPDLCCRTILSFLPSSDLKNVIATEYS